MKTKFFHSRLQMLILFVFSICFLFLATVSAQINPPRICTELVGPAFDASGETNRLWKKNTLKVRFLNGSVFHKNKVKQYAPEWSKFANIKFDFVEAGASDIRVAFKYKRTATSQEDTGSWSYVGTQSSVRPLSVPTMNFGWLDENSTEEEVRRVVLHEFGHALGLIHEHQAPFAAIKWNKPAVYSYYLQNLGWNSSMVDTNIFSKYSNRRTQFTEYDSFSIMHYPIPKEFTQDGSSVNWNTELSENDKLFVSTVYPRIKLSVYKITGTNTETLINTADSQLSLRTGERFRIKYVAPFTGYSYVIGTSADGNFLISPYLSSQEQPVNAGQLIKHSFRVTGEPSQENIIVIFSPARLNGAKLQQMLNSTNTNYDAERMRLPNLVAAFPSTAGLGAGSSLTCNYMKNWLGSTLGITCNETQTGSINQPVILRFSYNHRN